MKKKLLSIGLSLAVLGGSAVTAMPANAALTTPSEKVSSQSTSKQQAQTQIKELEKVNASSKEMLKTLDLQIANGTKVYSTTNDRLAISHYMNAYTAKRRMTSEQCTLDAMAKVTRELNNGVAKKQVSKNHANKIINGFTNQVKDSKKKVNRYANTIVSETNISKKYEKLGTTWKIQKPIYEKFDSQKISDKKWCFTSQNIIYKHIDIKASNDKDSKAVKVIASKLSNQVSGHTVQKRLSDELKKITHSKHSHNEVINMVKKMVLDSINKNNQKIAKLKLVK